MLIGRVRCEKCGVQNIIDPNLFTIWYSPDSEFQLVEAECPSCHLSIEARVDYESIVAFSAKGVMVKNFNDKFEVLNETDIDKFDFNKELERFLSGK